MSSTSNSMLAVFLIFLLVLLSVYWISDLSDLLLQLPASSSSPSSSLRSQQYQQELERIEMKGQTEGSSPSSSASSPASENQDGINKEDCPSQQESDKPNLTDYTESIKPDARITFENGTTVTLPRNKTLVVLLGQLRCGEAAWATLYKHLLDNNNADLALVANEPETPHAINSTLWDRAKYVWKIHEYEDWIDALELVAQKEHAYNWKERLLNLEVEPMSIALGGIGDHKGSAMIVHYQRWFLQQRIIELQLDKLYDLFVVTRTDHYYMCPLDLSKFDNRFVWVPEGQDWGGVADRYIMASSPDIYKVLDILPMFLRHPEGYADTVYKGTRNVCSRGLLSEAPFSTDCDATTAPCSSVPFQEMSRGGQRAKS